MAKTSKTRGLVSQLTDLGGLGALMGVGVALWAEDVVLGVAAYYVTLLAGLTAPSLRPLFRRRPPSAGGAKQALALD